MERVRASGRRRGSGAGAVRQQLVETVERREGEGETTFDMRNSQVKLVRAREELPLPPSRSARVSRGSKPFVPLDRMSFRLPCCAFALAFSTAPMRPVVSQAAGILPHVSRETFLTM